MSDQPRLTPEAAVLQGRIITVAFLGSVSVLAVVAYLLKPETQDRELMEILRIPLLGFGALAVIATPLVRRIMLHKAAREASSSAPDLAARAVPNAYLAQLIVGNGLAEGADLFGGVLHLLTGDEWGLLAAVAAVIVLAARMPSAERLARFTDEVRCARG